MGYLIDRQRALRTSELVAVLAVSRRKIRSQVLCVDGSVHETLTRPRTLHRNLEDARVKGLSQIG